MKHPKDIPIEDYTYVLPPEKIAAFPLEKRDASKLLIFRNGKIGQDRFRNLAAHLPPTSTLVFNATRVINARLNFLNTKNQAIEIFCLEPHAQALEPSLAMSAQQRIRWNCLVGNLKRWKEGDLSLTVNATTLYARLIERKELYVVVEFYWEPADLHFSEVLEQIGHTPIPPYLKRESDSSDRSRYQTIYAERQGSVAAPTAGLHFTEEVFKTLKDQQIHTLLLTLHVGAGTFKPVKSETMSGHDMHAEWIDVDLNTLETLQKTAGQNIIAVGTTSFRTLESLYWMGVKALLEPAATLDQLEIKQWETYDLKQDVSPEESLQALIHWMKVQGLHRLVCRTQILIAPPYSLKLVKGLITNFHQPQSTLLLLISAVIGDRWREVYAYALEHDFRFLSYGDSSLLLK